MIFTDESGADRPIARRSKGWAPSEVTHSQVGKFNNKQRYQLLAAYTQDGIELARIYPRSADTALLRDSIEQLLCGCGPWPREKSVLIMDNASFHHNDELESMVRLPHMPPFSPDFVTIEEYFAELKNFDKKSGLELSELSIKDFRAFSEACVDTIWKRAASARGHFCHAEVAIGEYTKHAPYIEQQIHE